MENSTKLNEFLKMHHFADINIQELSNSLLEDMKIGLQEQNASQQLMAVMPFDINTKIPTKKIIVIDAGGTNFRSCLVEFSEDGKPRISNEQKSSMIALNKEFSKENFFNALEEKISYLKDSADEIHFCFSYAMKNMPDGDAQVLAFSKQVKAKEVIGSYIGAELNKVLIQKGWTSVKKIKVINDTLACLLSGMSNNSQNFDSYIGFILGTGINNAYIEKKAIAKLPDALNQHIVVCECGMFNSVSLSDFDITLDSHSTNPGKSFLEKMCSGVYLGKIAKFAISAACEENLFSQKFSAAFKSIPDFSAYEISLFLENANSSDNILVNICSPEIPEDCELLTTLLTSIILRSAKITAAVILATALKSSGKNICITCNGSTFWKTTNFKQTVEAFLYEELTNKHNVQFSILKVEDDITVGTALA